MGRKFLHHTIICIGISFIDFIYGNITQLINGKRSSFLLIASFILIYIYNWKKRKNNLKPNNISFLKENEYKIKDNVRYNRSIEWGIEEEKNWRHKWNNTQPKETSSIPNKIFSNIISFVKYIVLIYINTIYMTIIEAFIIIIITFIKVT